MSPASLMTLGPCSTPLFFCREENMGVVKLLKMIGSLKVMIILKKKNSISYLSFWKRSAEHGHRMSSALLVSMVEMTGRVGKTGKCSSQSHSRKLKVAPVTMKPTRSLTKAQWDVAPEDAECVVGAGEAVFLTRQSTEYLWDCDSDNEYEEISS